MYLVQLLLPLYNNSGMRFEQELYSEVRNELMDRFGGITAYTRAPVHGLWHDSEQVVRDDLIIYEIMVKEQDKKWWRISQRPRESFPARYSRYESSQDTVSLAPPRSAITASL